MDLFELTAKLSRVVNVLKSHGDSFSGGGDNAIRFARQWVDRGFDSDDVDAWCEVDVWDAQAAKAWVLAGMTPDDVTKAAKLLLESHGTDSYTRGCPIYSTCNGDINADVIVDAHDLVKEEGI